MTGTTLSHYVILEKIGAGGMGVVYKARDTHLDRLVALKVLPPAAVADPDRKRRFVREAKAASSLNHPNIITIYDIDSADGVDFIAMELIAGQPLGQLIARKGLPWREAIRLAAQIASALAAAHMAGIVHRDLKPANVMVTSKGLVKVLDFGLAKLTERIGDDTDLTVTEGSRTEDGKILGTVAYMSPEQAQGQAIDARSDVFSFAVLLYEMLTGRRAFSGSSMVAVLADIVHKDPPPLRASHPEIPADLERLLARCLRKNPDRRLHHMADAGLTLEEITEAVPETPVARRHRSAGVAVLGGLFLVGGLAAGWLLHRPRASAAPLSFTQLTDQTGQESTPSLSPDGSSFVFASNAGGNWDIYLQRVDGRNPINLTRDSPEDDTQPAFSPDGASIAFRSERGGGGLFVMGATGESVKRLSDFGFHPAWHPGGGEILCSTTNFYRPDIRFSYHSRLFSISVPDGAKREVKVNGPDAIQPKWSPNGQRIAYWGMRNDAVRDIFTIPAAGGNPVPVTSDKPFDWYPVWSPDGRYLYFSSDRGGSMNLWRVPIDEESGHLRGEPEPVTTPSSYSSNISFSRDGKRAVYVQRASANSIHKIAFDPIRETVSGAPTPVSRGSRDGVYVDLSPGGEWLGFNSPGKEDIFLIKTDGSSLRQLTDDNFKDFGAAFSPDGKRICFFSNRAGPYNLWIINRDGSGLRQHTFSDQAMITPVWSRDGKRIAMLSPNVGAFLIDLDKPWKPGQHAPLPDIGVPESWFRPSAWSPDGAILAGCRTSEASMHGGIWLYRESSRAYERLTEFGGSPRWLSDGKRLLFFHQGKLLLLNRVTRQASEILAVPPYEVEWNFALSPDDRIIYFIQAATEEDVWLMRLP